MTERPNILGHVWGVAVGVRDMPAISNTAQVRGRLLQVVESTL